MLHIRYRRSRYIKMHMSSFSVNRIKVSRYFPDILIPLVGISKCRSFIKSCYRRRNLLCLHYCSLPFHQLEHVHPYSSRGHLKGGIENENTLKKHTQFSVDYMMELLEFMLTTMYFMVHGQIFCGLVQLWVV